MDKETLYDTLGVDLEATPEEIKKAYRAKSTIHHPDKEGGTEEAQRKLNHAYAILRDPRARETYDTTGSEDSREVDLNKRAYNTLSGYLNACIQELGKETKYNDIIKIIRENIKLEIIGGFAKRRTIKADIEDLIILRERFTYEGREADPFQGYFDATVKEARSALMAKEDSLRIFILAKKLLKGHHFKKDEKPQMPQYTISFANGEVKVPSPPDFNPFGG